MVLFFESICRLVMVPYSLIKTLKNKPAIGPVTRSLIWLNIFTQGRFYELPQWCPCRPKRQQRLWPVLGRTRSGQPVFAGRILTLPPCSIAESGAPISESARTGDSLRILPNRDRKS